MDKVLMLDNPHGYSIEVGNTSFTTTLDERIQAAKVASSISKQRQRQSSTGKVSLISSRSASLGKDTNSENVNVKKLTNSAQDFNRKIKHLQPVSNIHLEPIDDVSLNVTQPKDTNLQNLNNPSSLLIPNFNGSMQQRLEAIKNKKKLSSPIVLASPNILDSTKYSNTSSKIINLEDAHSTNLNCQQSKSSFPQNYEYKTRSAVQKRSYEPNILFGHCDRTRNITDTSKNSASSVQNRLIKAKEEVKAKSKLLNQNDAIKTETVQKPLALSSSYQDSSSLLKHKNRSKRLNQSGSSTKKNKPFISNNLDIKKVIKQQLSTVVQTSTKTIHKPTILKSTTSFNSSASSGVSTNVQNHNILKKSQQKELESLCFAVPQTSSVQQRLKKKKNVQCNNDDSMEWEDVEPENIVDKVNDFRKSVREYEPMEWTPDSIMHCDQTNLCLVIDTNILLSNLKLISLVIDKVVDYCNPTIALPWQVLQELDCLKKGDNAIGYRAREAARWLLDIFSKNHPRVKGQPMTLKSNNNHPDDAILECAISIKNRVNCVYLVTDDKMLSVKAEISGITAKNSLWLHKSIVSQNQYRNDTFQDVVALYPVIENQLITKCIPRLEHVISRILRFAVRHNEEFPSYSKKAWWKMYSLKPPLNLIKCLQKLKDHWYIIAPHQMLRPPRKQVEWLVYFLKELQETPSESILSWHEIYLFLKYFSELMYYLPYEYYDITDFLLNDLMVARRTLRTKIDCSKSIIDPSLLTDLSKCNVSNKSSNIENTLLKVLKNVETFWSNIYAASGIEHKTSKNELNCFHFRHLYSKYNIHDFCHKLSNLIQTMLKIKKMNTEQILKSHFVMDEFSKSIAALNSDYTEINKENLIDFCLLKEKNIFLSSLLSLQNTLSAMKNLVSAIKS